MCYYYPTDPVIPNKPSNHPHHPHLHPYMAVLWRELPCAGQRKRPWPKHLGHLPRSSSQRCKYSVFQIIQCLRVNNLEPIGRSFFFTAHFWWVSSWPVSFQERDQELFHTERSRRLSIQQGEMVAFICRFRCFWWSIHLFEIWNLSRTWFDLRMREDLMI